MRKWSIFRGNKKKTISLFGLNLLSNIPRGIFTGGTFGIIMLLLEPYFSGNDINFTKLKVYIIWYCIAFLLYIILTIISYTNSFVQSAEIAGNIRLSLGDKLRKLSLGFFKSRDPGDVTGRILHDSNKAEQILSHQVPDLISGMIVPVMLGCFLVYINKDMALLSFGFILVGSVFLIISFKLIAKYGTKHREAISDTASRILEYAKTVKLLKSYNMIGQNFKTMDQSMKRLKVLSFKQEVFAGIPIQFFLLILDCGYLATILFGSWQAFNSGLSVVNVITYSIIGYFFFVPVKSLGIMIIELRYATVSLSRVGEVFNHKELPYLNDKSLKQNNDIEFKNVHFSYGQSPVLKGINCLIPEGKMTALVGSSGSGKSTMVNLISRFWDVTEGSISIGGQRVDQSKPESLLKDISMVFQDVYLFNDTILNNIKIGKSDATNEEVVEASKKAMCHNFISELPDGYETIISEGGASLSGGEKQRISIARAILKDAPIVMLDEATASLDPENEAVIQNAFEKLVENKTLIVIAHKFKSIVHADQILVLDDGKISQKGTHNELTTKEGIYKDLWLEQLKAKGWKMQ